MTITTTRPIPPSTSQPDSKHGFTLAEVMIGSTLGAIVLAGVLSAFLMLGRSGMSMTYYSQMETEVRRALESFTQDLRMASNVAWISASSVTLTVPDNYASAANKVTYAYDPTAKNFYSVPGNDGTAITGKKILLQNVASFAFARFNRLDAVATADVETKRIQVSITVSNMRSTLVGASQVSSSASFILRNKIAN